MVYEPAFTYASRARAMQDIVEVCEPSDEYGELCRRCHVAPDMVSYAIHSCDDRLTAPDASTVRVAFEQIKTIVFDARSEYLAALKVVVAPDVETLLHPDLYLIVLSYIT
jgi:hypothetical protein